MKKLMISLFLVACISAPVFAGARADWSNPTATANYDVLVGTRIYTDALDVTVSSPTFIPQITLDGMSGDITATGDITAAGNISVSTISASGNVDVAGNITSSAHVYSNSLTVTNAPIFSAGIDTGGKHWEVIYSTYGVSVTTLTVSGLNGNVDKEYYITFVGSSTSQVDGQLYFNGDYTAANYAFKTLRYEAALSVYTGNSANCFLSNTKLYTIKASIYAVSGDYRRFNTRSEGSSSATVISYIQDNANHWVNTADNVTSISYAFVNSTYVKYFVVWARR